MRIVQIERFISQRQSLHYLGMDEYIHVTTRNIFFQQISLRWTYKLMWQEPRMILNASADWSTGEINVRGDMINNFWTPDIIIHDLVNFNKPEILNQVAALEIKDDRRLYYKVRYVKSIMENLKVLINYAV